MVRIIKILFFISVFLFPGVSYSQKDIVYTDASRLTLIGKAEPGGEYYHRVDTAHYHTMPKAVKKLFTNSAGLAIAFKTHSTEIHARWCVTDKKASNNMTPIMEKGLDLYIKKDGKWQFAGVGRPSNVCNESQIVANMTSGEKECLLYLPLYDETKSLEIGVPSGFEISPMTDPFTKKIVIYGSSILQGASASRPGMAYPSRLSRQTGLNFINLGLSGNGKMEAPVADMLADIKEVDAFILDCIPNPSPSEIRERTSYLVKTLRNHHPSAPIILLETIIREGGYFNEQVGSRVAEQNAAIREEYDKLIAGGVKNLYLIREDQFLGTDHEGSVDGVHPNDLGFDRFLEKIGPAIMKVLVENGVSKESTI